MFHRLRLFLMFVFCLPRKTVVALTSVNKRQGSVGPPHSECSSNIPRFCVCPSYLKIIAEAQKSAAERLVQQQQSFARSHLQFVPGQTTVAGGGAPGLISRVSQVGSTASSSLAAPPAGGLQRGGRKSKWDAQVSDDPNTKRARH